MLHLQADGALPLRSGLLLLLTATSTLRRLQLLRTHEDLHSCGSAAATDACGLARCGVGVGETR